MTPLAALKREFSLPQLYSVSKLSFLIKLKLEGVPSFQGIHVVGEITDLHDKGNVLYFYLKDASSIVRCVMFAPEINFELENGLQVIVLGSVSSYSKQSSYQLTITTIIPVGEGALALKLKQLKKKLREEGVFDEENKLSLPNKPKRIGIITGKESAAYGDLIKTAKKQFPHVSLFVYYAQVQGDKSVVSLLDALEAFDATDVDVVIVTRGGGGTMDLDTFNNELIARAIFDFSKPIVTAIGHDRDIHIADMVADASFATPTAAMGNVLPHIDEYREQLITFKDKLASIIAQKDKTEQQKKEKKVLYIVIGILMTAILILLGAIL